MQNDLRQYVDAHGLRASARALGVATSTITRALRGEQLGARTTETLRAKLRKREDYDTSAALQSPKKTQAPQLSWTLEGIRSAIESQMRGDFAQPHKLAEAMRRDDAIYVARTNRLAPLSSLRADIVGHDSARGEAVRRKASDSITIARTVLSDIAATLVDHGVAIGYVVHTPNDDGTRIDMTLTEWPIDAVRENPTTDRLEAITVDGDRIPIVHSDGHWIVFRYGARKPWRNATLLAASFVWAAHAECIADWSGSSRAHGLPRVTGMLPDGNGINEDGTPTVVAIAFRDMLAQLADGSAAVGIRPNGSNVDWLTSASNAWQVFSENVTSREKAAARIYNGTDAALGSTGGAPGVDIGALFGVATTRLQSDVTAIEEGLASGLFVPWCAINEGTSRYAPRLKFMLPDPDEDRARDSAAKRRTQFTNAIAELRAQGLVVTQEIVDALAREFGITPVPTLSTASGGGEIFKYHLDYGCFSKNEIRASRGMPPVADGDTPPTPLAGAPAEEVPA